MIYGSLLHGVGGGGVVCARSRVLIEFLKQTCIDTSRRHVSKGVTLSLDTLIPDTSSLWHGLRSPLTLVGCFLKETTTATLAKTSVLKRLCVFASRHPL